MTALGVLLTLTGFFLVRWFGAPTSGNVSVNRFLGLRPNLFDYLGIIMLIIGVCLMGAGGFVWLWHHAP